MGVFTLRKLLSRLDNIEEYILVVTFPLMLLFIFLATLFRYFQLGSLTWAEEAARYLMIWLAFAGISYGFKTNAHLGLSFFVKRFSLNLQRKLFYIRGVFIVLFGIVVSYFAFLLINDQISNNQLSSVMGIPIWLVYLSILFGSVMIVIRTVIEIISSIKYIRSSSQKKEL